MAPAFRSVSIASRTYQGLVLLTVLFGMLISAPASAVEPVEIEIWHTQSMENGEALRRIVEAFNDSHDGIHAREIYIGGYDDLYRKLGPSIRAGRTPALAVAYESMVSAMVLADVVEPFDGYVNDPEIGLSADDKADIFPAFLETNRYPSFDNQMLSFPFTKSVLLMYYNKGMLLEAGYDEPPRTWDEFVEICRAVKTLGKQGYALSVDASTLDGMIYSFGGELIDEETSMPMLNTPAVRSTFGVIETLINEGLAYRIPHRTYDDRSDVGSGRTAFFIRSSTSLPYLREIAENEPPVDWDATILPHGEGCEPVTVLFGANICMFKTTPAKQRAAWQFVKYFISTDVTAQWAMDTGYLPVRKSAAELPELKAFYAQARQNRRGLEAVPFARAEPKLVGWQDVRDALEAAEVAVILGKKTAEEATADLQGDAIAIMEETAGPPEASPTDPGFLGALLIIATILFGGGYLVARGKMDA